MVVGRLGVPMVTGAAVPPHVEEGKGRARGHAPVQILFLGMAATHVLDHQPAVRLKAAIQARVQVRYLHCRMKFYAYLNDLMLNV